MITIQKYVRAQSLEEAWQLNQNKRNRILGGMLWMRLGKGSVNTAIDLCAFHGDFEDGDPTCGGDAAILRAGDGSSCSRNRSACQPLSCYGHGPCRP